jgi:D-mycarose 3-C-methyltransferase
VAEDISGAQLYEEYNYASSTVPGLVRHFIGFSDILASFYGKESALTYLEIGCNDGVLLNQLPPGWRRIGVDPSDVSRRAGAAASWRLVNRPFTPEVVRDNGLEASVDVLSGSNCLAHITDLREVFAGAALALKPGGHFWVEVHDLAATLSGGQWDTIYHEHLHFHSLTSLQNLLSRHGFYLEYAEIVPMHAGSLRIIAAKLEQKITPEVDRILKMELESGLNSRKNWNSFASQCWDSIDTARSMLIERQKFGEIWAYGAAGRATMWIKVARLDFIEKVIDSSPLRAGHFIAPRRRIIAR